MNLKGEISLIFFYGEYSHSVIKKPAEDDFRVQGQYGGKNFVYNPTDEEIEFGKLILSLIDKKLCYARVDIMYNNQNKLCLGEIELIEPFLFMTMQDKKTNSLIADNFVNLVRKNESNLIKTDN